MKWPENPHMYMRSSIMCENTKYGFIDLRNKLDVKMNSKKTK